VLANPFDSVGKRFASSTWFTTSDFVAKNTDVVRRFLAGLLEASRYETAHPTQMGAYLAPYLNMDEAALAKFPRTPIGLALDPSDYQPVIDLAARYGVIPKRFPAADMLTPVR
jgi:NitT/TauT family transport system substrate-binding protein